MVEAEWILNGRPLIRSSDSSTDAEPLIPNHLLLLWLNLNLPPGVFVKMIYTANVARSRFANVFWKRWLSEYLPSWQDQEKWIKQCQDFAVGDLVLIADEWVHHGQWPLGHILEVHPGRDGDQSKLPRSRLYWQGQFQNNFVLPQKRKLTSNEELYLIYIATMLSIYNQKDLLICALDVVLELWTLVDLLKVAP